MIETLLFAAADDPTGHVKDVILFQHNGTYILTMHMITLALAALLTVLLLSLAASAIATGPESEGNERYVTRGRFAQVIEAMILYLRNEMLVPVLGEQNTRKFFPYLMSLFFFILCNNLLGLIPLLDLQHLLGIHITPVGGTATANISITAGLALIAGLVIVGNGVRDLGIKEFFKHMTGGLVDGPPLQVLLLSPIILLVFIVEIAGLLIKPTALAIRLFANMVAGHTLLAVLLGFGYAATKAAGGFGPGAIGISALSLVASLAIFFLEVFVAVLQAFIFMFLTAVFISLLSHHEEHEHDHGHEHDEAGLPVHAVTEASIA